MGSDPQSHLIQQHEAGLADARRAFEYLFGSQMAGKPFDLQASMAEKILATMKTERETLEAERDLARRQLSELKEKAAKMRRLLGVARDEFNHLRGIVDELLSLVRNGA